MRSRFCLMSLMLWAFIGCSVKPPLAVPIASRESASQPACGVFPVSGPHELGICDGNRPKHLTFLFTEPGAESIVGIDYEDKLEADAIQTAYEVGRYVFVERHINPHLAAGVLCDLALRRAFVSYGTVFAVDAASGKVASWTEPQTPDESEPGQLVVSGHPLLSVLGQGTPGLHWEEDGSLLLKFPSGTAIRLEAGQLPQ